MSITCEVDWDIFRTSTVSMDIEELDSNWVNDPKVLAAISQVINKVKKAAIRGTAPHGVRLPDLADFGIPCRFGLLEGLPYRVHAQSNAKDPNSFTVRVEAAARL